MRAATGVIVLAIAIVLPRSLTGQSIRGILTEKVTGQPVSGSLLVLLDSNGSEVASTMSSPDGAFLLSAPAPGVYVIRADRIGFASSTTEQIGVPEGGSVSYSFAVEVEPVSLESLAIAGRREGKCHKTAEADAATFAVWDEARKSLENVAWADTALKLRFGGESLTQYIDAEGEPIAIRSGDGDVFTVTAVGYELFRSLPAADLQEIGWVVEVTEEIDRKYQLTSSAAGGATTAPVRPRNAPPRVAFFGPDARVLLSDEFHETHCFRIAESRDGPSDRVGLGFRPVDRRTVDIEGTLWLNGTTAELDHVDFRYVGDIPRLEVGARTEATALQRDNASRRWRSTGRIEFERLDGGPFIVRSWWIQVPGVQTGNPLVDERGVWTRKGGRVTRVLPSRSN